MRKIGPPLLYKFFISLMIVSLFLDVENQITYPLNLIGLFPLFFGSHMALQSKYMFKRTNTPMHPFTNPTKLHQEHYFKYSRNPMYLGIAIGLLGIGLLSGVLFNLIYSVLYLVLCDVFYVRAEEKKMLKKFKSKYKEYMKNTRRWI